MNSDQKQIWTEDKARTVDGTPVSLSHLFGTFHIRGDVPGLFRPVFYFFEGGGATRATRGKMIAYFDVYQTERAPKELDIDWDAECDRLRAADRAEEERKKAAEAKQREDRLRIIREIAAGVLLNGTFTQLLVARASADPETAIETAFRISVEVGTAVADEAAREAVIRRAYPELYETPASPVSITDPYQKP